MSDFTIDNVTYELIESTSNVRVKSFNSATESAPVIPGTVVSPIDNLVYTVTEIGESAFENKTAIVEITLPNSITIIGAKAFKNCTSLQKMNTQ